MCQKRNELNEQILHCRSELSKICSVVLVQSIRAKIQDTNSELFKHLHQIKAQKLGQLSGPWKLQNCCYHSRKFTTFRFRKISSQ